MKTLPLLLASLVTALPAIARPDADYVPVKIVQITDVVFPKDATQLGVRDGAAQIIVQVDEKGVLSDYLVTSYTVPVFAEKAVNAIKAWRFEPARLGGQPRGSVTELNFVFTTKGMIVTELNAAAYLAQRDYQMRPDAYAYRARTLHELDRIPTPSKIVKPVYPLQFAPKSELVSVEVEFYIDEQGRVRLPSVDRETNQAHAFLAAAAVEAVSQWSFEPPTSHGRPVLVLARQEFKFQPQVAAAD